MNDNSPSREVQVKACILNRRFDLRRWSWSVSVDGRWINREGGYTLTKWGALHRAHRWHSQNEKNRLRQELPAIRQKHQVKNEKTK